MFEWINSNREWLFSGIGVSALLAFIWLAKGGASLLSKARKNRFRQQTLGAQPSKNKLPLSKYPDTKTQSSIATSRLGNSSNTSNEIEDEKAEVKVHDGSYPIEGATVLFGHSDGTYQVGTTDAAGMITIPKPKNLPIKLLVAHPDFLASSEEYSDAVQTINIQLQQGQGIGSIICFATGYIPGLQGRLNPILDTSNRTYLYADNIAIEGGQQQPTSFKIDEPFRVEDRSGNKFDLTVLEFVGRASLIEYANLQTA